ncbi:Zinc finger C2H2-type,Protein arginine N-methyltransferase,S-adenosyl-L-methionine-dependent [Cinara cedri]|uniref:type I protein arginine methyltransferase n=1 Tax=Cinara cedri TaxID=506608 RepID=A0A5E4M5P4_9HEMI|nr:Zinc finger C2H2-type,Protein arginine N-methyltransferase,S-adenosyl-L-methionine-dependent [Cinara cedri]
MSADSDSDHSFGDWVENGSDNVKCLFCDLLYDDVSEAIVHCTKDHSFDIGNAKRKYNMDIYSYIKCINYTRTQMQEDVNFIPSTIFDADVQPWNDDKYLTPVVKDDPWLMIDIDDVVEEDKESESGYTVNFENNQFTLSSEHFNHIQNKIQTVTQQLELKENELANAHEQINQMQNTLTNILSTRSGDSINTASTMNLEDDQGYFASYSCVEIHYEMLKDKVRTESYSSAILMNAHSYNGKTVLDLGTGSGILSMFMAKAQAAKVFAVDEADVLYNAVDNFKENGFEDIIVAIKGRIEDVSLPVEKVDAIVSEWMGYFLLFESMLDSLIFARDKYLDTNGIMLPNECNLFISGVSDMERHDEIVGFWSNVYGFRMPSLRTDILNKAQVEIVPADRIVTEEFKLCTFDLYTCDTNSTNFKIEFELKIKKTSSMTGIVGYFDSIFDNENPVTLSTAPYCTPTHWKQTVFLLPTPIDVIEGNVLAGEFQCARNMKQVRTLIVTITINNKSYIYNVS